MQTSSLIYGNCCVLSPEDILMFRCNDKKANWYLSRGLAELISDNPLTIKLKFVPKGMGNHNKYGLSKMENRCVNCGNEDDLTRHHVVPFSYRKFFPMEIKSHNFHDVLPMCVSCHEKYERKADELKKKLDDTYNAPIYGNKGSDVYKYIKMAKTLLNPEIKLPKKRRINLTRCIKEKFGIKRLSKVKLKKISQTKHNINRQVHGEIVVNRINDLQAFIEMWRRHFIENNDCKYLPKKWDVEYKLWK